MSLIVSVSVITEFEVEHDCIVGCPHCSCSGEGMADGARCVMCKGTGVSLDRGWVKDRVQLFWNPSGSGFRILGSSECEACGVEWTEIVNDDLEDIIRQLPWLPRTLDEFLWRATNFETGTF
jgi:hypothetical protein